MLHDLYKETILDHNRMPRNFRKLEGANHTADGHNPLCGDRVTIYLDVADDTIREIGFDGSGCAISKASASMMTEALKGKSLEQADAMFTRFHDLVTGRTDDSSASELGKLVVFAGVREFPVRVKCATLAWHTLKAALEDRRETATTE